MKTILHSGVFVFALCAFGFSNAEQPRREHAAHVHGHATGTLAEDSGRWQLMLELPGHNLLGFEQPPENAQQRGTLDRIRAHLESGDWLEPDSQSACRVIANEVRISGYGVSVDAEQEHHYGAEGHDHHHPEEAPEDHQGHEAFLVEAVISCDSIRRMRWLDIDLFDRFPDNHSIRIDVFGDSGAASERLDSKNFRIRFD